MMQSERFPSSGYGGRAGSRYSRQQPFCLIPSSSSVLRTATLLFVVLLAADPIVANMPTRHSLERSRALVDVTPREPRIVGGSPIDISCAPYQVKLVISKDGFSYLCGGVIIDLQYVVTARHCILKDDETVMEASGVTVYAGSNTADEDPHATKRTVTKIWSHPSSCSDVALLKLSSRLPVTSKITPIKLSFSDALLGSGSDIAISGWGLISGGGSNPGPGDQLARDLRGTTIDHLPSGCSVYGAGFSQACMICAGCTGRNVSSCQGDSGGPATTRSSSGGCPILLGLTSYTSAAYCGRFPSVWARASRVVDWLELQAGRVFRSQYNIAPTYSCQTCAGACRTLPCRTCSGGCRLPAFNATRCRMEAAFAYGWMLTLQSCRSNGDLPLLATLESSPYLTGRDVNGQVWFVRGTARAWSTITLGGVQVRVPVSMTASAEAIGSQARSIGWTASYTWPGSCRTRYWYAAVFVSYDRKTVQVSAPKRGPRFP